jgi:hypothetical protein
MPQQAYQPLNTLISSDSVAAPENAQPHIPPITTAAPILLATKHCCTITTVITVCSNVLYLACGIIQFIAFIIQQNCSDTSIVLMGITFVISLSAFSTPWSLFTNSMHLEWLCTLCAILITIVMNIIILITNSCNTTINTLLSCSNWLQIIVFFCIIIRYKMSLKSQN